VQDAKKKMTYIGLSVLIMILTIAAFYLRFEKKKVRSRRLVIIAVMTALSVLGRFIFGALPAFKPITAIVIVTAIWMGPECGFMVGTLTALISNFYFGQGPWTPFQMLAWGFIGLTAGLLSKPLKKNMVLLAIFGALSGVFYSCFMDIWTVLFYEEGFVWTLYKAALITAIPYIISYAVSTVVFLLLIGKPFGEKFDRVINKYGI
jgi:energy-coupling factor transport system substrate-specific component